MEFDLNTTIHNSYAVDVESAYIITLMDNKASKKQADACMESCKHVGMPAQFYPAVDGTGKKLIAPYELEQHMTWLKVVDQQLSQSEIACALTHISLWCRCLTLDKPIVILEHDAIMLRPYQTHRVYNTIVYLGSSEQVKQGWPVLPIPPHGTNGPNYHFMLRAHAYAIDPAVARNLVAHVIRNGIHESLDIMIRADLFSIVQDGLYAYDNFQGKTTITNRKKSPDGKER